MDYSKSWQQILAFVGVRDKSRSAGVCLGSVREDVKRSPMHVVPRADVISYSSLSLSSRFRPAESSEFIQSYLIQRCKRVDPDG